MRRSLLTALITASLVVVLPAASAQARPGTGMQTPYDDAYMGPGFRHLEDRVIFAKVKAKAYSNTRFAGGARNN